MGTVSDPENPGGNRSAAIEPGIVHGDFGKFRVAWWLQDAHAQTLWPALFRRPAKLPLRRETFRLADGDFLDLDWHGRGDGPIVLLLHGLTGSSRSGYIRGLMAALERLGWRALGVNFRGCSGRFNETAWAYHSGETQDLDALFQWLRHSWPDTPIAAVGFSLGGNMLLKWLGEAAGRIDLFAGCAVSVPFRLDLCATRMDQGFSRVYRNQLIRELKTYLRGKRQHLRRIGRDEEARRLEDLGDLRGVRSFWEYDERVVARLYGFDGAADYYRRSSSRQFLKSIEVPTLLIQADDDPFLSPEVTPLPEELSTAVVLELTRGGGHVGFISGSIPAQPEYWLEKRIPRFLGARLATHLRKNHSLD